jgi:uncharacterized protein (DUF1330 family)
MEHLTPDPEALTALGTGNPDEPIVMLNLLRFREVAASGFGVDGMAGRDAYMEYGRRFTLLGSSHGGKPVWMGTAVNSLIGPERWDLVLLVRYPTRRQFIAMINDPEYRKIAQIRHAALADSRLIEMTEQSAQF